MQIYKKDAQELHYKIVGSDNGATFIWTHGWGQSHAAFLQLVQPFEHLGQHILIDFPGFGDSPAPRDNWSTADYADFIAAFIKEKTSGKVIWIGHSFGCRVGIQIASRHPDLIKAMALLAGAGLKRKRPLHKKLYLTARIKLFKALKKLIPLGLNEDWLRSKFGSADYRDAGAMRGILNNVIQENLVDEAKQVQCPTLLTYGSDDTETPPEIGHRLNALIKNSQMITLDGQDHYTILGSGRHQLAPHLKTFFKQNG